MPRSVALISLYPVDSISGGGRYTFCTLKAIQLAGDECRLFIRTANGPAKLPFPDRLTQLFTEFHSEHESLRQLPLRELLLSLAEFDVIWIHQFLSCDAVFDIIGAVASDQLLLFTNLGDETLIEPFRAFYIGADNHGFVEVSEYAAQRSRTFRGRSVSVTASIWRNQLGVDAEDALPRQQNQVCSIHKVLSDECVEKAILNLPDGWNLAVIGPEPNQGYGTCQQQVLACEKVVRFTGSVSKEANLAVTADSICVVDSACSDVYEGNQRWQFDVIPGAISNAVAAGQLPISPDVLLGDVMQRIGLGQFLYSVGDPHTLHSILSDVAGMSPDDRAALLYHAKQSILRNYLWDDFWPRTLAAINAR